jgi:hypothetical protein
VACLRRSLGRAAGRHALLLTALEGRLLALAALAEGRAPDWSAEPGARQVTARFLRRREGRWHDGDENLVRGLLDRWQGPGEDAARATAAALLETAARLARAEARPETLWFFLWELQSLLAGLAPEERADTARGPC